MDRGLTQHSLEKALEATERALDQLEANVADEDIAELELRKQLELATLFLFEAMRYAGTFDAFVSCYRLPPIVPGSQSIPPRTDR